MAQQYKVTQVVERDKWGNDFGEFQTYAVKFEDSEEWVKWNRKLKDGKVEAPKVGDEVFGKIEGGKFSLEKKDGFSSPRRDFTPRPDHHEEIKAQWAIGQSLSKFEQNCYQAMGADRQTLLDNIEDFAKELYAMVDKVKGTQSTTSGYEKAKQTRAKLDDEPEEPDEVITDIGDEPIDLKDIPF